MKKPILLIVLFFIAQISLAQDGKNPPNSSSSTENKKDEKETTLVAVYDFETQEYTTGQLKPKHKQPVVLKIININKIANSVEIISNDVKIKDDFLDSEEKVIKQILESDKKVEEIKPNDLNVDLSIPSKTLSDNESNPEKSKEEIKKLNANIDTIEKSISILNIEIENKQESIKEFEKDLLENADELNKALANDAKTQTAEQIKSYYKNISDGIENNLKIEKQKFVEKKVELSTKKKELIEAETSLNEKNGNLKNLKIKANDLQDLYTKFNSNIKNINRLNSAYNSYIDYIINPNLTSKHYRDDAKAMCVILKKDQMNDYYSYISTFDTDYNNFIDFYNNLKNNDLFYEVKKIDESYANLVKIQIENLKRDVDATYKLVNVNELRKKLNNVEIINNVLSKEKAFEVVSNPIQPLEDYLEFKVKIKQNKELGISVIKENEKDFTYIEYVRQGVRWDVSVGTVFDFGIKDQEYEIKELPDNKYQIIENNTSNYTPTIAGILHTSFRSNSMFAFGLSLGASINVTELNFNSFFPGVSLLIGKREKMVFTVGPAFKRVNQLKSIYKDAMILDEEIQITDITSPQFKIGYFFGITYNLTSKQKSKIKP